MQAWGGSNYLEVFVIGLDHTQYSFHLARAVQIAPDAHNDEHLMVASSEAVMHNRACPRTATSRFSRARCPPAPNREEASSRETTHAFPTTHASTHTDTAHFHLRTSASSTMPTSEPSTGR